MKELTKEVNASLFASVKFQISLVFFPLHVLFIT